MPGACPTGHEHMAADTLTWAPCPGSPWSSLYLGMHNAILSISANYSPYNPRHDLACHFNHMPPIEWRIFQLRQLPHFQYHYFNLHSRERRYTYSARRHLLPSSKGPGRSPRRSYGIQQGNISFVLLYKAFNDRRFWVSPLGLAWLWLSTFRISVRTRHAASHPRFAHSSPRLGRA